MCETDGLPPRRCSPDHANQCWTFKPHEGKLKGNRPLNKWMCLCRNCIASRDPYCGWTRGSTCSFLRPGTRYDAFPFIYTSPHAVYSTCPASSHRHAVCVALSLRLSQVLTPILVLSLRSKCLFWFGLFFCFFFTCFGFIWFVSTFIIPVKVIFLTAHLAEHP